MKKKVRDTSIIAYHDLINSGELGKLQEIVLELFYCHPNSTDKEISVFSGMDINSLTPRRNELVEMGVLTSVEKRHCQVTNRLAYAWYPKKRFKYNKLKRVKRIKCKACGGKGWVSNGY